jgi:hypothetical protein
VLIVVTKCPKRPQKKWRRRKNGAENGQLENIMTMALRTSPSVFSRAPLIAGRNGGKEVREYRAFGGGAQLGKGGRTGYGGEQTRNWERNAEGRKE